MPITEKKMMAREGIRDVFVISVGSNATTVNDCTYAYLRTYLKEKEKTRKKKDTSGRTDGA